VRRVATAAVFGGAAGLLIGTAINGRGWVAVPVMIVVAGVSALLSSVGAVWSSAGLFLLIYAALGTGPVGALRPWWLTVLWFLAGVGWWLVLLVPGWLAFPRVFALALPYGLSRNYGLFTAFFAPLVVLLIDLLSNDGWQLASARLIDTAARLRHRAVHRLRAVAIELAWQLAPRLRRHARRDRRLPGPGGRRGHPGHGTARTRPHPARHPADRVPAGHGRAAVDPAAGYGLAAGDGRAGAAARYRHRHRGDHRRAAPVRH